MVKVEDIAPGLSIAGPIVIEVTQSKVEPDHIQDYSSSDNWSRWGADNCYPQKVIDRVTQDTTSMGAMSFKVDAHYGGGIRLVKKKYEGTKEIVEPQDINQFPEIDDFFFENDIQNFAQGVVQDYEWWNRYHVPYIPNKAGNKILRVNGDVDPFIKTKDVRKALRNKDTGKVDGFYLSNKWPNPQTDEWAFVPAFDKRNPFSKPLSICEHLRVSISHYYYPVPAWQSKMKWLEVASRIPTWILSNIDNAMNLKYHVEIPEQYFLDLYPDDRYDSDEDAQKARYDAELELKQAISDSLTGAKNVSKVFYTKFAVDDMGKQMPGWAIHTLDNKINDQSWLKADQVAASRILTADGVPPSLAGIIIGNTSSGSASDVREQFNYYLQMKTVIARQTTTEWFDFVKRFNGWDRDLYLDYKQIILQSLDENKSGSAKQGEPAPTTDNPDPDIEETDEEVDE